nr:MAG TPA: ChiA1-BD-binding domain protein [Caudoviricetes sp.]
MVEFARRDALRAAQEAAVKAAQDFAEAVRDEPAKDVSKMDLAATIGPGERVLVDGVTWKNVCNQWLSPFTQGPKDFWRGWMKCSSDGKVIVGEHKPWAAGVHIGEGDQCQHVGRVWRCVKEHDSSVEFAPDKAPALWQAID